MSNNMFGNYYLEEMAIPRNQRSLRVSSWDRSGGNYDWLHLRGKEKKIIANLEGPGCIKHFYALPFSLDPMLYRNVTIRAYWDNEERPSIEVPLGDFFGIGNCKPTLYTSMILSVNQGDPGLGTQGLNSYFPMPFSKKAIIEIENESDIPLESLWYHINYQKYDDSFSEDVCRFHAQWRKESPTKLDRSVIENANQQLWEGKNTDCRGNYVILDAKGDGHLVGIILNVDNIAGGWWGEGDDMAFIDGEQWPPSIHGTGTEEVFGGGACPTLSYNGPYSGFPLISNENWYRQTTMYRFFIADPLRFKKSIHYSFEHGHANNFENDYSSVAFWYQHEPHHSFPKYPDKQLRRPYFVETEKSIVEEQCDIIKYVYSKIEKLQGKPDGTSQSDKVLWPLRGQIFRRNVAIRRYTLEGKYDMASNELKMYKKFVYNKIE